MADTEAVSPEAQPQQNITQLNIVKMPMLGFSELFSLTWEAIKKDFRSFLIIAAAIGVLTVPYAYTRTVTVSTHKDANGHIIKQVGVSSSLENQNNPIGYNSQTNLSDRSEVTQNINYPAILGDRGDKLAQQLLMGQSHLITISTIVSVAILLLSIIFLIALVRLALDLIVLDQVAQLRPLTEWRNSLNVKRLLNYFWIATLNTIIILIGFIVLIIPGIVFAIWLGFTNWTFVIDQQTGINALKASRNYTRGYWWDLFWRTILAAIVVTIIGGVVGWLINALLVLPSLSSGGIAALPALIGILAVGTIGGLTSIFLIRFNYQMFVNLKQIKGSV